MSDERIRPPVLVVDLGGTQVRVAISRGTADLAGRVTARTENVAGPEPVVHQIKGLMKRSLAEADLDREALSGAVVATPGPVTAATGIVYSPPNMAGWGTVPLQAMLEEALGLPVRLINDANAAALGEFSFGAGRGSSTLVYITISTGIGGGVIVDGRLLEGASGTAGEIGHMTIDRTGPVCPCGNVGCLEAIASGTSIARRFNAALTAGERSARHGPEPARAEDVARLAREGDQLAAAVMREAAEAVGIGVINAVHLFNPDTVVLGGGVTQVGDLLFAPVRELLRQRAMRLPAESVRVIPAGLGDNVGLVGAGVAPRDF